MYIFKHFIPYIQWPFFNNKINIYVSKKYKVAKLFFLLKAIIVNFPDHKSNDYDSSNETYDSKIKREFIEWKKQALHVINTTFIICYSGFVEFMHKSKHFASAFYLLLCFKPSLKTLLLFSTYFLVCKFVFFYFKLVFR